MGDDRCWNHDFIPNKQTPEKGRFKQCTNKATWFYYDDSARQNDKINVITGVLACQLCDPCYEKEKLKPESQQVFEPELFRRRKNMTAT